MYNYVVTAQKPTSVSHSVVGNFTSPTARNLIVSKSTRLEIYLLTPEGVKPIADVAIYGRIATLHLFRPEDETQDLLFLSTEKFRFCVLGYDERTGEIITRANGDLQDRIGRLSDAGQLASIDPQNRMIAIQLYDGLLKIIPLERALLKEAFNLRLEELSIIDIKFLHGHAAPTVAILYQDPKEARHVKTYQIHVKEKELSDGPWQHSNVEAGSSHLIPLPLPLGGALIIGETTITYQSPVSDTFKSINMKPTMMRCWNPIDRDGSRYLLGDHQGQLYVLALAVDPATKKVADLKLEVLGETSIPSTLNYLDKGFVFVGSAYGDSQVVRLSTTKNAQGTFVEVVENWTNLGPIVDLCVVDLERQGQGQVVTCSGAFHNGSLRVIRNGIGISEQASIDLTGVKGIWSMKESSAAPHDKYLVVSFVHETHFLAISGETELEETENVGSFLVDSQTLYCGNMLGDTAVQVTAKLVRLIDLNGFKQLAEWTPPAGSQINHASCNSSQLVVALGGGTVVYLELSGRELREVGRAKLEHEVACVNIAPLAGQDRAAAVAVGLWTDVSVRILRLPNLVQITQELLGGTTIPRSVLFASFEGVHYLLCGLGDGHLFNFILDPHTYQLSNRKKLSLGTQPVLLNAFSTKGSTNVFSSSDRPMVIYSKNKKLLYSNVNLKEVSYMAPFNAHSFPDSLAIATENRLVIGTIDEIQKLHIRTVPLGEMPRRIAHHEALRAFLVLTQKSTVDANGEELTTNYARLIDDQTFEVLSTYTLEPNESGCSVQQCTFTDDPTPYFVVGTATVLPAESEPSRGRVLVFGVSDRKLVLAAEKEVKGAVYAITAFNGKALLSVNSRVHLYRWSRTPDGGRELVQEAMLQGHILALYLASRGDFFVVGDLLKSISLSAYKPPVAGAAAGTLEELARDQPNWMTAVEMLDDDHYLGAENSFNLFTVCKNADAATDEERARLRTVGEYHLGEFVNRFRSGSLVMKLTEGEAQVPTLIFGTVSGTIGVIATISSDQYHFFAKLQSHISNVVKGVGGFKHKEWRAFSNERKTVDADKFIDGDLIESFLDLNREKMQEVANAFGDISVEDICKRIESLSQLTH